MQEATERELALLTQKSSARKGKIQVRGACSMTCEQEIAKLQRRLDAYEEFVQLWEPKLKKWESMIDDRDESKSESGSEGNKGKAAAEAIDSDCVDRKGDKYESGNDDSEHSSAHSGSAESKSKNGSESEAEDDEGTVKEIGAIKTVDRPGNSNAAESNDTGLVNAIGITTKEVGGKCVETGEQVRSVEAATKTGVKRGSSSTVMDPTVTNTAKVPEKVRVKEVRMNTIHIINCMT